MKSAFSPFAMILLLLASIAVAQAQPVTDVQEYANNTATEYFVPSDAQKYNDPYWRRPYEDWSWQHNPIIGDHQSITLQIAAFDVDYTDAVGYKSEDDKILVKVAGQWVEVGMLAAAPDEWSFSTFDLTHIPGIKEQVNNGLEVMVDIDWDEVDPYHPGAFRLTLAKATLAVDGGAQACNPNPDLKCTTLQPIQFTDVTNAAQNTRYASNQIQVNIAQQGDVTSFPLTLSAGQYRVYNGSGWTMWLPAGAPYNVASGYLVEVRNYSATGFGETTSAVLNIAGVWDSFDITTQAIDQTPQPFVLTDVLNAEVNTNYLSNVITITDVNTAIPISIVGGEYFISGRGWSSANSTVVAGDQITVRRTSSSQYSDTVSAVLTVGTFSESFDITTREPNLNVEPFSFIDVIDAEPNQLTVSNTITVKGPEAPVSFSVVNGQYSLNGGIWKNGSGTASAGDSISVRRYSPNAYESTLSVTLTVGNQSDNFDITTRAANLNVNPFTFVDKTNAELNTRYNSNSIVVSGPELPVAISIVNGSYSVNGGTYMAAASTVKAGDIVTVRGLSANDYQTAASVVLTIGNQSDSFDITTRAAVTTVNPFTFIDKVDAELDTSYTSNTITVSGPEEAVSISIVNGQYSVNGGVWTSAAGNVIAGDTVAVRRNSSTSYETAVSTTLTIGGVSDAFDITTRAAVNSVNPFTFIDKVDAELNTRYTSNTITVSGPEQAVAISVINGEYSKNGGAWTSAAGNVNAGDTVAVRRNSATAYETTVSTTLTIGTMSDAFDITTRVADLTVDPFIFVDKFDVEPNSGESSNIITVSGPEAPVSISIVGGYYSVNGNMPMNRASTVNAGDTIQVQRSAAATYETTVSVILSIGNQSDSFDITTRAANLNVDPFAFKDVIGAELDSQHDSNFITVSGPEQPVSISIVNGSYTINGSALTTAPGTISAGDRVSVRGRASVDQYEATTSVVLSIGNQGDSFDITTRSPNLNVNPFTFNDVTGVELNSLNTSNSVIINGPEIAVSASAISGEMSINGGAWLPSGMVNAGDSVRVRGIASSNYETTTAVSLMVGNKMGVYNITTRAANLSVAPFTFVDKVDADLNTLYSSNGITVSGPEQAVAISIVNGQYSVNGGAWTSAVGSVNAGDTVVVRRNSASNYETAVSAMLTIGNQSDSFDITTRVANLSVNPFSFMDVTNAELSTFYTSNSIAVTGPEQPVSISIVGGEYSINGGAWTSAIGSISAGDSVSVRRRSGDDYEISVSATLTIGNQSDAFDITTRAGVMTVDPFSFIDVTNAELNTSYSSNVITVTGPELPVFVTISSGEFSVNGGAWTSMPSRVVTGDTIAVRNTSSSSYETTVSATLTIGDQSDSFDITTRSAMLSVTPFNFIDVTDAELNTIYVSNGITVSGPEQPVAISVVGGQYSINGGVWSNEVGTISAGDVVTVRRYSASTYESMQSVTLTIGTQSDSFDITTRAANLNVDPFSFVDKTDAELDARYNSNSIVVSGPEQAVAISIVNGSYSINGGTYMVAAGTVKAGDTVTVRGLSANQYQTTASVVLTIGNQSDSFDITTRAAVTTVNPFTFIDKVDAELNTSYTSNTITVSGPEQAVSISIANGEYSVNGGAWTSAAGNVNAGDTVAVRRNSSTSYETAVSTNLTIGGVSDAFDITTRAAVNSVNPFTFIDKVDAELNTSYTSNTITVSGPEQAVSISIANGEYSVNGGAWTSAAGNVNAGDTVAVRRNSSTSYETMVSTTLTIGGVSDAFDITTRAAVTNVNAFTFIDKLNAELNTSYTSNTITVSGPEQAVVISIVNGQYSVNGGAWTSAAGNVNAGDTVAVRRNSSTSYTTTVSTTLTIGNQSDAFDITTKAMVEDITPDPFSFDDVTNAELNTSYLSNAIMITGINVAVSVSIVDGEYRVNGGSWTTTAGSIIEGDVIEVQRNSSAMFSTMVSAVLTVGNVSDSFGITTKADGGQVCTDPDTQLSPEDQIRLVESELAGLEYSLDIWDSWSTGYCADIVVTNTTSSVKPYPYGVHFTLSEDTQFNGTWNGDVQRNGNQVTVIFPSWMQDVEANSPTLSNEQFGFCTGGKSEPQAYTQYIPDFTNLSIEFIAHNVWNGGYCGHFEMTYTGSEAFIPAPNMFNFKLPQSVQMTEFWNEVYTRDGDDVTVDLPFWTPHIYQNSMMDPKSGFCVVGEELPCGTGYNGGNSVIVERADVQDTYVAAGDANTNHGASTRVQADGRDTNYDEYVSLLKWDMSFVPQGAVITGADLTLNIYNDGGQYGLFAMHGAWSEMTATWNNADVDASQGVLIGIIEEAAFGKYTVSFNDRGIALVQQWVDGGENHGLMIRTMGSEDGIIFDSREDDIAANRPILSVTYKQDATPAVMPTMVQLTDGVNGYSGTQDSRIKSGSANTNYGDYEYVTADALSSSSELVGLLKWDLSSIPSNAKVVATEIELDVYDTSSGQYNLYAMKGSWDESSVTWNSANIESNQGVLMGSVIPTDAHKYTLMLNDAGVELVQGWIDGSVPNNGLIIRSAGTTNGMRFRSSEYGNVSERPTINVTYH